MAKTTMTVFADVMSLSGCAAMPEPTAMDIATDGNGRFEGTVDVQFSDEDVWQRVSTVICGSDGARASFSRVAQGGTTIIQGKCAQAVAVVSHTVICLNSG